MVKPNVMDASDLVRMLNATHYAPAHLEEVRNLCRNYPMFSLAHMLKVRILESLGRDKERELKLAAVYACNRSALHRLVSELNEPPVREEVQEEAQEEVQEGPGEIVTGIQFSEEPDEHADVIIEQHAPYAAPPPAPDELLELDQETADQALTADQELPGDEELSEDQEQPGAHEQPGAQEQSDSQEQSADQTLTADQELPGDEELSEDQEQPEDQGQPGAQEQSAEQELPGDEELSEDQEQDRDPEVEEGLSSETLIESVVKDEADMEETVVERNGVPAIDRVEEQEDSAEDEKASDLENSAGQQKQGAENHLIRDFISQPPGPIRADRETSLRGDVSQASAIEHDGFITDTLAQIYVKQGLYAKAIYAYEKLSLKYPEKSAYFAAQIDKIKNINHS